MSLRACPCPRRYDRAAAARGSLVNRNGIGAVSPGTGTRVSDRSVTTREGAQLMADNKVWFITGAGRGLGIDIAQAALAAGHSVVATGRDPSRVAKAIGVHENLLAVALDVTDPACRRRATAGAPSTDSAASTCSSTTRATSTPASSRRSAPSSSAPRWRRTSSARSTSPARSCRSCAPQRSGQVITVTLHRRPDRARSSAPPTPPRSSRSRAGWSRCATTSRRTASRTMVVEPGFFRTELLVEGSSTIWPSRTSRTTPSAPRRPSRPGRAMNGQQGGDPTKLAQALVSLAESARAAAAVRSPAPTRWRRRAEGPPPPRPRSTPTATSPASLLTTTTPRATHPSYERTPP